ncbi:hypothetical protein EW026_g1113 [Hermanssonia centrifuga]|uniref:Fungal-type protein kinase domain-containing protein n=1 Tax=Hermanssonia centrifuga TaxID=98765 RepID=A0A4S4KX33_9APHY|nr:hypothetical protein EW026_g1113 [Hermanssonia centrifuga]
MKLKKDLFDTLQDWRGTRGLPILDQRTLLPVGSLETIKRDAAGELVFAPTLASGTPPAPDPDAKEDEQDVADIEGGRRKRRNKEGVEHDSGSSKKRKSSSEGVAANAELQAGGNCVVYLRNPGIVMEDEMTSLWYYDAAGIVHTKETPPLFDDFEEIDAVLVGFSCCEFSQWGSLPLDVIKPPASSPCPESFPPRTLKGYTLEMTLPNCTEKVFLTLQDPIFMPYSLVGRRTFLYKITTNSRTSKKPMVAKFSYQCICGEDFWKMSESVRAIFHEHVGTDDGYEDRVFRGLVYTEYLPLKQLFSEPCDLLPTMINQMLDCLFDLRYKAKILHRDISSNNVMYEVRRGKVIFILIDFDYATLVDDEGRPIAIGSSSKHRTCTLPFMAYDLVKDMADRHKSSYQPVGWESGEMKSIAALKKGVLLEPKEVAGIKFPFVCAPLKLWIIRFCKIFRAAKRMLDLYEGNEDTASKPFNYEA